MEGVNSLSTVKVKIKGFKAMKLISIYMYMYIY